MNATIAYRHRYTGEIETIPATYEAIDRFFDNRNPFEWAEVIDPDELPGPESAA